VHLPPALQASADLFSDMAIYDYQTTPDAIKIGGNSQITFIGKQHALGEHGGHVSGQPDGKRERMWQSVDCSFDR
jgi:hypothetical protein